MEIFMKRAYFKTAKIAWQFWDELVEMKRAGRISRVVIKIEPTGFRVQWNG
jgi:hypothetical protein